MKLTPQQLEELDRLVSLLLEGTLGPQEFKRLEQMIAESAEAQWYYITRVDMVGSIGWALHSRFDMPPIESRSTGQFDPDLLDLLDELPDPATTVGRGDVRLKSRGDRRRGEAMFRQVAGTMQAMTRNLLAAGLGVAVLLIGIGLVLGLLQGEEEVARQDPADAPVAAGAGQLRAATLVATHDCQWLGDQTPLGAGERLQTGEQLSLERGTAEFLFEGGARVILQGPCTFRFDSPSQGTLVLGSLTAQVAEEAVGFSIESGKMKIIDLGTEFGMAVSPSGAAQTEVFVGEVSVRVRDEATEGWGESRLLTSSEVLSIDSQGEVSNARVIDSPYVRQMPGAPTRIAVRNPSFEQPVLPYGEQLDSEGNRKNHGEPVAWQITKRAQSSTRNGCLRPLEHEFVGSLPHGRQIGYTNRGETLSQVLKERCAPDATYKLTVWVGIRREEPDRQQTSQQPAKGPPGAVVELVAGETVLGRCPEGAIRGLQPGRWQRVEVECRAEAGAPYVGLPLAIRLSADAASGYQVSYDAVELVRLESRSDAAAEP